MDPSSPSWGLVLVRIVVGFVLIVAAWSRIQSGADPTLVESQHTAYAAAPELVRAIGDGVVSQHPSLFGHAVAWAELVCGVCLFLGLLTRPAGFLAAFLFASGWFAGPESERTLCLVLGVCCFACALSRAGRRSGADVFLDGRLPVWMTWTRSTGPRAD